MPWRRGENRNRDSPHAGDSRHPSATHLLYPGYVTSAEFKRWLEKQGCAFEPAKGSHLKVRLGGRAAILPMHGKKELGKGLENAIRKQLGLK